MHFCEYILMFHDFLMHKLETIQVGPEINILAYNCDGGQNVFIEYDIVLGSV